MAGRDTGCEFPTTSTWWLALTSIKHARAIWNRMDKSEHVGYWRETDADYEGENKFAVFRGDGLKAHCEDCSGPSQSHSLRPDDFLGYAATEHEAALMVQEYCESTADEVTWQGNKPTHRHQNTKHPRARRWWV